MYFLYRLLGVSAIIGSTVCIITMIPLQFIIGKKMSENAEKTAVSSSLYFNIESLGVIAYTF